MSDSETATLCSPPDEPSFLFASVNEDTPPPNKNLPSEKYAETVKRLAANNMLTAFSVCANPPYTHKVFQLQGHAHNIASALTARGRTPIALTKVQRRKFWGSYFAETERLAVAMHSGLVDESEERWTNLLVRLSMFASMLVGETPFTVL